MSYVRLSLSLCCHHERPLGREGPAAFPSTVPGANNSRFLASLVMTISEASIPNGPRDITRAAIYSQRTPPCRQRSERGCASFGDGVVLLARTTAHADRAHDFSAAFQRNASSEDHDLAIVGDMNAEELSARLRMRGQVLGPDIERARGVGLLHGTIDAADPRAIHAHVGNDVDDIVSHRDVHGLTDLLRLLFGRRDHAARICKIYSRHYSSTMS